MDLLVISLILLLRIRLTRRYTGLSQGIPRPVYNIVNEEAGQISPT
jgi:hypothetical protein